MSIDALSAASRSDPGPQSVTRAIRQAASQSGLDFDLMLGVAKRESSLQAGAKAATSSASGLFQFIDQTWLGAVKEHGAELGLADFAKDIVRGERGFEVADPARRQEILDLRFDPATSAKVAGKTLAGARDRLSASLGRAVSASEVYMAHFLGERGALRMLEAGDGAVAADVDPRAAGANRPLFFDGSGRPLRVSEFRDKIALHIGAEPGPKLAEVPDVKIPYSPSVAPRPAPRIDTYAPPSAPPAEVAQRMPPQLYAAILEMQSEFISGRREDH